MTYLTDPAAHVPWCHPSVDVHLTVTGATARDAHRYGVDARPSGPLCRPGFDRPRRGREAVRRELGIPHSEQVFRQVDERPTEWTTLVGLDPSLTSLPPLPHGTLAHRPTRDGSCLVVPG